jgi:hypothetical protein
LRPGLAAFLAMASIPAFAQELKTNAIKQIDSLIAEKKSRTAAQAKIDSHILYYLKMSRGIAITPEVPKLPRVLQTVQVDKSGNILADIRTDGSKDAESQLTSAGVQILKSHPEYGWVRAAIPASAVEYVAGLTVVKHISRPDQFTANQAVDAAGDIAHRADKVRAAMDLGFTGKGIKVGVISTGVDSMAAQQLAGALPKVVTVLPGQAGRGDEGTAMLEIVHALAPDAQLYFSTSGDSMQDMANNILGLATAGCNIIVDDITFFREGVFQDDVISRAVNSVTKAGVVYFSSAANSGHAGSGQSSTWEGDFQNSGVQFPSGYGGAVHSFAGPQANQIVGDPKYGVALKWADPLGKSGNDYDVYILDSTLTYVLDASTDTQDGSQNPVEYTGLPAKGDQAVIVLYAGAARALHLNANVSTGAAGLSIGTTGNTYGHNAAQSAITVAAVDVSQAKGGTFAAAAGLTVESFSSDGLRRMFFNENGQDLTAGVYLFSTPGGITLQKPNITAADGVMTTVAGFNPFYGTSAAAPHAAAIAALLMSAGSVSPGFELAHTAFDMGTPGADRDSGAGVVDAYSAMTGAAHIISPLPKTALNTRNITFHWSPAAAAVAYRVEVGTSAGAHDVYSGAALSSSVTSATIPNLPGNGAMFYVRLYTQIDQTWEQRDATFVACSGCEQAARITTPTPGILNATNITFQWSPGTSVLSYRLAVGNAVANGDIFNQSVGLATSQMVTNLDFSGGPIYVQLTTNYAQWSSTQYYVYTACTGCGPVVTIVSPAPGSTLASGTATFRWNGLPGATSYTVELFRSPLSYGTFDYFACSGAITSCTVTGLPTDGQPFTVRLYTVLNGLAYYTDNTYTAYRPASPYPQMVAPAPGSVLTSRSVTFSWATSIAPAYALVIGSTPGGSDIFAGNYVTWGTSQTVTNLPNDGRLLYVRVSGGTGYGSYDSNYTYTACRGCQ